MFCSNHNVSSPDCFLYFYRFGGISTETKPLSVILIEQSPWLRWDFLSISRYPAYILKLLMDGFHAPVSCNGHRSQIIALFKICFNKIFVFIISYYKIFWHNQLITRIYSSERWQFSHQVRIPKVAQGQVWLCTVFTYFCYTR